MSKFSIITICYNEPRLEETCQSIVNQTFQDFEWIVIDAGSNAETLAIFEKYKSRINYFVSEPDNGRYNGMNKGILQAKGEYLNFMNAGDSFYKNDILEKISQKIGEHPATEIFYGWAMFDINGELKKASLPSTVTIDFLCGSSLHHQAMFFKQGLLQRFGLYDESFDIISDWVMNVRLVKAFIQPIYIDTPVAKFDCNGISSTDKEKNYEERLRLIELLLTKDEAIKARRLLKISMMCLNKKRY